MFEIFDLLIFLETNLTGKCVYEELSTLENLKYAEIPLHKLSSGYYIIQVQTSQELTNKKFTISK